MKLFYILFVATSLAFTGCSHKKTHKILIHKVHTPKIKGKPKAMPEEKPIKEEKVSPPSQREKEDDKCWFNPCK